MTDDATLSEFVGETGESDGDDRDESGEGGSAGDGSATADRARSSTDSSADAETDGDDADATAIDSGLSTYAWGAYTCSRCDSDVERVWREDGSFVCPDCKSW